MKDDELVERIVRNPLDAGLDQRRRSMVSYVEILTREPSAIRRAHVDAMKAVGFADEDVLAVCEVAAYYAYVNRIVDGLGVELEPDGDPDKDPDKDPQSAAGPVTPT